MVLIIYFFCRQRKKMYSCHYCEFQHTRFDSIVIHLVNLHPFRKISVDHITLCEVSGKFLTTNYSWPFNPSDVTSHYKILANDEQRNITLEPLCTEADDNSEIQENNTSPTQLEPHDHSYSCSVLDTKLPKRVSFSKVFSVLLTPKAEVGL